MAERAIAELGGVRNLVLRGPRPEPVPAGHQPAASAGIGAASPQYAVGDKVAAATGLAVRGYRPFASTFA